MIILEGLLRSWISEPSSTKIIVLSNKSKQLRAIHLRQSEVGIYIILTNQNSP